MKIEETKRLDNVVSFKYSLDGKEYKKFKNDNSYSLSSMVEKVWETKNFPYHVVLDLKPLEEFSLCRVYIKATEETFVFEKKLHLSKTKYFNSAEELYFHVKLVIEWLFEIFADTTIVSVEKEFEI